MYLGNQVKLPGNFPGMYPSRSCCVCTCKSIVPRYRVVGGACASCKQGRAGNGHVTVLPCFPRPVVVCCLVFWLEKVMSLTNR